MCRFKCAIVLCDQAWLDPDLDHTNGISMRGEGDMLRMDAVITSVQLNIRCLLEVGRLQQLCPNPASWPVLAGL